MRTFDKLKFTKCDLFYFPFTNNGKQPRVRQRIKEHPYHQLPLLGDDDTGAKLAGGE
jgi:hypothetical protein